MKQHKSISIGFILALCTISFQLNAAIPAAWITITRNWSDGCIYMWNTGTKQAYRLYQQQNDGDPDPTHCAFSPDGKRVAFIVKKSGNSYGVMVANNDGTGLERICTTFSSSTTQTGCNICWTERGLFWTENTRQIYWADPDTKQSKSLGTLTTNTTGNHLRMSRDGSHAYLRTNHEPPYNTNVGGLFFETNAGLTGIINERPFGTDMWDHGSAMLNDGSACVWVIWNCSKFGSPSGCAYHKLFGIVNFATPSQYTILTPNDSYTNGWELSGPGDGPYTTPSSGDHILYRKYSVGDNPRMVSFIMNINTRETVDVTPNQVASGGPISAFTVDWDIPGEFWLGDLPNPNSTTPSIAINKTALQFTNQTTPIRADTVTVTNSGAGTLTAVSVAESPTATWLTEQVTGSGNTQRIIVQPTATGLSAGNYTTTITVSGGGAANTRTFTVALAVGQSVLAPSALSGVHNTGKVNLTWTDNSTNETGFELQRRDSTTGTFAARASVAANAVSFIDSTVVAGKTYGYRLRAVTATASSLWSDTASVTIPLPPIVLTAPTAGISVALGSQLHVRWSAPTIQSVQIDLSVDDGLSWTSLSSGSISQNSQSWGDFVWTVPTTLGQQPSAQIRVSQYGNPTIASFSGTFGIGTTSAITNRAAPRQTEKYFTTIDQHGITFMCAQNAGFSVEIEIQDIQGRQLATLSTHSGAIQWRPTTTAGYNAASRLYLARFFTVNNVNGARTPVASQIVPFTK